MLYRFALALGLLFLGIHVGREISRPAPVRTRVKPNPRSLHSARALLAAPIGKASVH